MLMEREEEGNALKVQRPIYFIREVLSSSKIRYTCVEKLIYVIFIARRKLLHYFESHPIQVVTSSTIGKIIQNRDVAGRVV